MAHLLTETVRHSLELAQGQMASGRSPLAWNTLRNWSHDDSDHGLAPSATRSNRSDDKLTSLWSLVANNPQCRSRDFTTATLAANRELHLSNFFQAEVSGKLIPT